MEKSTFVIDVDGTICIAEIVSGKGDYANAKPIKRVIRKIQDLRAQGHTIILFSARGMRTYQGDTEMIEANIRPVMEEWLARYSVPYDTLILGKPWGPNVYYIDDRCLGPDEFANHGIEEYEQITLKKLAKS
jgi:capsule biosynthesis phosphatase